MSAAAAPTAEQVLEVFEAFPPHLGLFMRHVKRDESGRCWLWTGNIDVHGYGTFRLGDRGIRVHRVAYELFVGPIPEGYVIDHVRARGCTHKHCVNPAHLEAVTHRENILRGDGPSAKNARKSQCKRGHAFAGDNLIIDALGRRVCRVCENASQRRRAGARR